ncbi:MAG: putative divalent heavy-metal cations transporter [Candidatus Methanohalarchaeum thermophilum]|uniref:Divalent heavy-metal cations transporter n=1 Tax=Methanohalarchaeum thermophilum TaxID=1903181 RepID=A0A1Q6DX29_METT1|nr:MAG: putative divalent heavy-metal cations transporter [Candidatus Methanohalarchaeum thermophilum]
MEPAVTSFMLSVLAGLSTGIGALIGYFIKEPRFSHLSFLMGFSAGVMIYVSFVELLGNAIQYIGFLTANIAFFSGVGFFFLLDIFIPHAHLDAKLDSFHESSINKKLANTGILVAIGLTLHNFPEGIAVFTVSLESLELGFPIAIAIAIHNIPEGIAVSVPIYYATGSEKKAFTYSMFSGIAEPIGAASSYLILAPYLNKQILNIILATVAGIMVFISFDELLPISQEYGNEHISNIGLFLGMLIMMASLTL